MKKRVVISFVAFLLISIYSIIAPSQTSALVSCTYTEIGDAPGEPVYPPQCSVGPVVDWAQKIADKLEKGNNNLFSKLQADICNSANVCARKKIGLNNVADKYWCSQLVLDAYELAGNPLPQNLVATGLYADMADMPNFVSLPYSASGSNVANLQQVKPGYAIGFGAGEDTGSGGHIGLVKTITVDANGNGTLVTLESNSSSTSHTWPIDGGVIKKGGGKPIFGFVGPK